MAGIMDLMKVSLKLIKYLSLRAVKMGECPIRLACPLQKWLAGLGMSSCSLGWVKPEWGKGKIGKPMAGGTIFCLFLKSRFVLMINASWLLKKPQGNKEFPKGS